MISMKHYAKHIIEPYFALDTNHTDALDFEQVFMSLHSNSHSLFIVSPRSIN